MPPRPEPTNQSQIYSESHDINDRSGKWKSTQDLQRGHLVLKETPILSIAGDATPAQVTGAIAAVNEHHRAYLDSLQISRSKPQQSFTIIKSKGFRNGSVRGLNQPGDVASYGLFPKASRFHQSCTPNTHGHWNSKAGCMEYRVVKDIVSGSELSISFDPARLFDSGSKRHQFLSSEHQIACSCTISTHSDIKRQSIGETVNSPRDDSQIDGALQDLQDEDLYWQRETLLFDRYRYGKQSNLSMATAYLQDAYEATCILVGDDDDRAAYLRSLGATRIPAGRG